MSALHRWWTSVDFLYRHRLGELEVEVASLQTQVVDDDLFFELVDMVGCVHCQVLNREKRVQELEQYLSQMKERYEKSISEVWKSYAIFIHNTNL